MNILDIKTLTYTGNTLDINGKSVQIETALIDCDFVQFHKGRDYYIEEPKMEQVPLSKYEFLLKEYEDAIYLEAIQSEQEANELANKMNMIISPRQARLILLQYGLLDDIEIMLSTDRAMQIWWEYSLDIKRSNEHIINAGIALNLTEEQLDMMFIEGSKL